MENKKITKNSISEDYKNFMFTMFIIFIKQTVIWGKCFVESYKHILHKDMLRITNKFLFDAGVYNAYINKVIDVEQAEETSADFSEFFYHVLENIENKEYILQAMVTIAKEKAPYFVFYKPEIPENKRNEASKIVKILTDYFNSEEEEDIVKFFKEKL